MSFSPDGRFIAVVVDPLRGESGVFNDPNEAMIYSEPTGELELSPELEDRYLMFLNEMESVREKLGFEELPFIISGDLHRNTPETPTRKSNQINPPMKRVEPH